ncbi:MAG: thrombospondin type 3 repeat-containing protein, partial [Acidobacteriota bacterium]
MVLGWVGAAVLAGAASLSPALGTALHVDDDSCPTGNGTLADPFCTIQEAICAAVAGDTVNVAPGLYLEAIRMRPGVSLLSDQGPAVTTINAFGQPCTASDFCGKKTGNQCSVVVFASGHTRATVLDGFTLTGGEGLVQTLQVAGGGIFVFSSATITNNVITGNILAGSRDQFNGAGIYVAMGSPLITGNVISGNQAIPAAGNGGGVTRGYGGGIWVGFYGYPTITDNVIENNVAGDPALNVSIGSGGGIALFPGGGSQAETLIDGNLIDQNVTDTFGGGISINTVNGSLSFTRITNNVILSNIAAGNGGGVYSYFNTSNHVNNTISDNMAMLGGGFFSGQGDVTLPVNITNNIIDSNRLELFGNGGGLYTLDQSAVFDPSIENNDFWANQKNQVAGDQTDATIIGSNGNFSADPLFVDRLNGDFHLDPNSPAVDTALASKAPAVDFDDTSRGFDGDGVLDSPQPGDVDVGAFEMVPSCVPSPEICDGLDNNCDGFIDEGFPDTDGDGLADCVDPDDDNDGFLDTADNCPLVANDQTDTDGDGMGDACDPDDDNDGVPDPSDNCPLAVNPLQLDRDGDGPGNACDLDADGDGQMNSVDCSPLDPVFNAAPASPTPRLRFTTLAGDQIAWDRRPDGRVYALYTWTFTTTGFQRAESCAGPALPQLSAALPGIPAPGEIQGVLITTLNACGEGNAGSGSDGIPRTVVGGCADSLQDTDMEGYPDVMDNCPGVSNALQGDADGDGFGDACDACAGVGSVDTDADTICDAVDNCPDVANPGQVDTDGNGIGDACSQDDDGDGFLDTVDNCPLIANDQTDTDSDGAGNACDTDDDNDGLDDGADLAPLDPTVCADADGDLCDDCAVGVDGFGPLADNTPANDGTDTDADGACDLGDPDDDNDGLGDGVDLAPLDPTVCADADADLCDDCAVGVDGFGPLADNTPANDGTDTDA